MTAKEYLSQAYMLERRIRIKQEQIDVLRTSTQKVTATYSAECVSHSRNVTSLEDGVLRLTEAQGELNAMLDEMLRLQVDIASLINRVSNENHSLILTKRYLRYQSWEEIANEMNYTSRWVLQQHGYALKAVDQIMRAKAKEAAP